MIIGVPKETKIQEHRVALVPAAIPALRHAGHSVRVERGAGEGSGFSDAAYAKAGAELVPRAAEAFAADLIVKVKEPQPGEVAQLRAGQILFTYLHLAANRLLTESLLESGVTAIAYETVTQAGRLPLLEPMSEIAGRMSVLVGATYLSQQQGGAGILLAGVPGVLPGRVAVLGGGTAGVNAARMATGLGAEVTILDIDLERLRFLDLTVRPVRTLFSSAAHLAEILPETDLLIGAVLRPGARAPKLVSRELLGRMRPGSVFVDIAIDQGGCAETSRPTSHDAPVYTEAGVLHYCVTNMPGSYARTATQALTNATTPYLSDLANLGLEDACRRQPGLIPGVALRAGQLFSRAIGEAHGLPSVPFSPNAVLA